MKHVIFLLALVSTLISLPAHANDVPSAIDVVTPLEVQAVCFWLEPQMQKQQFKLYGSGAVVEETVLVWQGSCAVNREFVLVRMAMRPRAGGSFSKQFAESLVAQYVPNKDENVIFSRAQLVNNHWTHRVFSMYRYLTHVDYGRLRAEFRVRFDHRLYWANNTRVYELQCQFESSAENPSRTEPLTNDFCDRMMSGLVMR